MNTASTQNPHSERAASTVGTKKKATIGFLLIVMVAALIRIISVPHQSLTWDEIYELTMLSPSFSELVSRPDGFPPLFAILFSYWNKIFIGDHSARWFSLAVGMLSFWPLWNLSIAIEKDTLQTLAEKHSQNPAAPVACYALVLGVAALTAFNPLHHFFSTEGRAYSLMLSLSIFCVVSGLRAIDTNSWWAWISFAVAGVLGVYTHYYSLFVGALVFAVLILERKPWTTWRRALVVLGCVIVSLVPILGMFRSDLEAQVDYAGYAGFSLVDVGYTYFSYLAGFCLGPSLRMLHSMPRSAALLAFVPWVALLGSACLFLCWCGSKVLTRKWMIRLVLWATLPTFVSAMAALTLGVSYNVRYTIPSWTPVIIWLAAGASSLLSLKGWRKLCGIVSILVLLASSLIALGNRTFIDDYENADFRRVAQQIEANSPPGTTVFVNVWYQHHPLRHYLSQKWNVVPSWTSIDDGPKFKEAISIIDSVPLEDPIVLLYSREFHGDYDRRLLAHIKNTRTIAWEFECAGIHAFFLPCLSNPSALAEPASRTPHLND